MTEATNQEQTENKMENKTDAKPTSTVSAPKPATVVESAKAPTPSKPTVSSSSASSTQIAVIRIRSSSKMDGKLRDTLRMLNLPNQHNVIVIDNKPNLLGMIKKVKDYVTWGEVSADLAKTIKDKKITSLHPPRGGFERKGIKASFDVGGALGYRGEKINDLLKKMM